MLKQSDLTKAELLQVVEMLAFGANKYYLDRALGRIEMQRNDAHFETCRKLIDEEKSTMQPILTSSAHTRASPLRMYLRTFWNKRRQSWTRQGQLDKSGTDGMESN